MGVRADALTPAWVHQEEPTAKGRIRTLIMCAIVAGPVLLLYAAFLFFVADHIGGGIAVLTGGGFFVGLPWLLRRFPNGYTLFTLVAGLGLVAAVGLGSLSRGGFPVAALMWVVLVIAFMMVVARPWVVTTVCVASLVMLTVLFVLASEGHLGVDIVGADQQPLHDYVQFAVIIALLSALAIVTNVGQQRIYDEQDRLRDSLARSERLESLGSLSGSIAHEFNNLLTVVTSLGELMHQRAGTAEDREDLESILQAGQRAASLTRQMLAFSRQEQGSPETMELNTCIRQVEALLEKAAGPRVALRLELVSGELWIDADPRGLEQSMLNLIVNARDAMDDRGEVVLRTRRIQPGDPELERVSGDGPHVLLEVQDDGSGMDADTLAKAFEPFFTTKPRGQGTGLGLPGVQKIVERSGGTVWIDSEPDRGTTVRCAFAELEHQPVEEPEASVDDEFAPASGMVLVVDDEPLARQGMTRSLVFAGYDVMDAEDGPAALALWAEHRDAIDVLVTDLLMVGLDGLELAAALREDRPELPVVLVSGYTDTNVVPDDVVFVGKPFTPQVLLDAVEAARKSR